MKNMKRILTLLLIYSNTASAQSDSTKLNTIISVKNKPKTITVGGANADVPGFTNQAIQMAVDALPVSGGTVKLNPGEFKIMAPVKLPSNTSLIGSGNKTILKRINGYHSKFIIDADYGQLKVTVENAAGFAVGMSVQITDTPNSGCWDVSTAVITDIVDNVLFIDTYLIRDYKSEKNGVVTNAGSCVSVLGGDNILISNFTIDGNKDQNDLLDGCNGGGIVMIKSKNITVDNVEVRDFNGEGITWQITEDITVKNCEIHDCTNMAMHPGSGSPNSIIEGNKCYNNKVGLFICWRVQNSLVQNNQFFQNSQNGISTGHKDTDVLFSNNHIYENGGDGVYFRDENEKNAPNKNVFVNNVVENNNGYGFSINGEISDILLKNNTIRDTKKGTQKAAVFVSKKTAPIKDVNNKMSGHTNGNVIYQK
jgi:parallel beta-helix repeat protein